jgi:hypothetical protein
VSHGLEGFTTKAHCSLDGVSDGIWQQLVSPLGSISAATVLIRCAVFVLVA